MHFDMWTLSLQVVNFLVLVWLLWRFLFHPVKDIIDRRKELADAATGKLEDARKAVEDEKRRYEDSRRELAEAQRQVGARMRDEMASEREKILEQAREEAGQILSDARDQIARERETAIQSIRGEVASTASGMAAHLLKDASPETYTGILLARIVERLRDLSSEERRQVDTDLAGGDTEIEVVTAAALDEPSRGEWTEKLHDVLGTSTTIEFTTDPDLIAGAVFKLPHAVIEFNWADQLEAARDRMNES